VKPLDYRWVEFGLWLDNEVLPAVIIVGVLLAVCFI
jgi:hypothetical protein